MKKHKDLKNTEIDLIQIKKKSHFKLKKDMVEED